MRTARINTPRPRDGFTLIEALIAMSVMMTFFAAMTMTLHTILNLVGESRVRTVAAALAQEKLEQVRNLAYEDVGVVGGIPPGSLPQEEVVNVNGQDFTVKIGVVFIDDPFDGIAPADPIATDYKRVRVTVSWGGAFPSKKPLTMVSDAAPDGLETDVGGGTLWVNVIDAVGGELEGATVRIQNDDVVPAIDVEVMSDSKGRVILPGAPECSQCYRVTTSKNGYSSDRTYGTEEVTNPSKPHATVIEGEVTELTFAIDLLSSLSVEITGSRSNGYPPFSGVEFTLKGSKTIGTNAMDEPVYRFEQNYVSGAGGLVTVADLEWDTYEVFVPTGSSVDVAGTVPVSPFPLSPGQNKQLKMVTTAASPNSLLVVIKNMQSSLIADAEVEITDLTATISGITGPADKGDYGQVWFGGLSPLEYVIHATKSGYLQASSSATVTGDVKEIMLLESN